MSSPARTIPAAPDTSPKRIRPEVSVLEAITALTIAAAFVVLTRGPVLRPGPFETDEFGFLQKMAANRLPMHHTLFLASGRVIGEWVGDPYRGLQLLDMAVSAAALVCVWWWLRAVARPATALAATVALGFAPVFWSYGAMAGNYTAIVLVGAFLLGVAARTWTDPKWWHPYAATLVLTWGTAYRQDIGTFWLGVYFVIHWPHRWARALTSMALFAALNLAWISLMLLDVGGWDPYKGSSTDFAYHAGYLNSLWCLGVVDAPVRYAVKLGMALIWTLGPGLLFLPRGMARLARAERGTFLAVLVSLSVLPAAAGHLLIHFGVPGYAFHYVPALMALLALGIGRVTGGADAALTGTDRAPARLAAVAAVLALVFLFYPTNYDRPGFWGDFDLSFARHTRAGLLTPRPFREPSIWRTANSLSVLSGRPRAN